MIKKILGLALLAVIVLTIVLLINTFRFPKGTPGGAPAVITGVSDSVAQHLSAAIQIKTVSLGDTLAIDTAEFLKFRNFMETTYPVMNTRLPRMSFNE